MAEIAEELPSLGASFVLLGTGERAVRGFVEDARARYPDRIGARIGFDEALAHRIEAGADLFLMPSRFEPCGLNQMYSLRYGTVPVVRATGGLYDTVRNFDPATGAGTGFTFEPYSAFALLRRCGVRCGPTRTGRSGASSGGWDGTGLFVGRLGPE